MWIIVGKYQTDQTNTLAHSKRIFILYAASIYVKCVCATFWGSLAARYVLEVSIFYVET